MRECVNVNVNVDSIRQAVRSLEDALSAFGMHICSEVDSEIRHEAYMALEYLCRVLAYHGYDINDDKINVCVETV